MPYTYYLYHKPTGKKYYSVRYKDGCSPSDLWVDYFSSSKKVKALIKEYGADSFNFEVRRVFDTKEKAVDWETKVLKRLGVVRRDDWLNQTDNKIKITEKGVKFSKSHRENIRKAMLGVIRGSQTYIIENPNGEVFEILNLKKFCFDNQLSYQCMINIVAGKQEQHKGYKATLKKARKERKSNSEAKRGRSFKVIDPDGNIIEGHHLGKFCKKHGLCYGSMVHVIGGRNKQHKGYTRWQEFSPKF